jgi:hypothetical protein
MVSREQIPGGDVGRRRVDDAAIAELLDLVREARTSLSIDLSAAAGALEAGRPEVASDIVAAASDEIRLVGDHVDSSRTRPVTPRTRTRRRRLLLALPVVPVIGAVAMTAAAAIGGSSTPTRQHHAPAHQVVQVATSQLPSTTTAHMSAATTLHRLEHVVKHHPEAAQVLAVADDLHHQLTVMIASSTDDPARLHVVRQLLLLEQHVLEANKVPGTQLALAASREIARLLELTPITEQPHSSFSQPTATTPTTAAQSTSPTSSHTIAKSPPTQSQPTNTTAPSSSPGVRPTNALFGRGLFRQH